MSVKPILFNTAMVMAILDGRKTVTRRVVKPATERKPCHAPYQTGDILYVRETWSEWDGGYLYKAWNSPFPQPGQSFKMTWHPSIHMPKEAARIWLKVTDVRVERLQDMWASDTSKEGMLFERPYTASEMLKKFSQLWDSTIKKQDLDTYGWDANPWVWVIEFERCEKPEEV